ncbi:hypothetical protein BH23PAT2_BH23PAT2_00340 [soil metagenome]
MLQKMKTITPSQPEKNNTTTVDYEQLGRMLEMTFMTGYSSRKRYYRMAFVKGLFTGLGSVIGATVVLALLLWTLSLFETFPLIGPVLEGFQDTVNSPQSI